MTLAIFHWCYYITGQISYSFGEMTTVANGTRLDTSVIAEEPFPFLKYLAEKRAIAMWAVKINPARSGQFFGWLVAGFTWQPFRSC